MKNKPVSIVEFENAITRRKQWHAKAKAAAARVAEYDEVIKRFMDENGESDYYAEAGHVVRRADPVEKIDVKAIAAEAEDGSPFARAVVGRYTVADVRNVYRVS